MYTCTCGDCKRNDSLMFKTCRTMIEQFYVHAL